MGESAALPLRYYATNVGGTVTLLRLLEKYNCRKVVFSSSATVYGDPSVNSSSDSESIHEEIPLGPTSPYGRTKFFAEEILRDVASSAPGKWKICILRYFNPFGCHPSGDIGEDPTGIPNNLVPFILQVPLSSLFSFFKCWQMLL